MISARRQSKLSSKFIALDIDFTKISNNIVQGDEGRLRLRVFCARYFIRCFALDSCVSGWLLSFYVMWWDLHFVLESPL